MVPQEPTLRVRINQIDYTVVQPGALDNSVLPKVPVIRIYGGSSKGTKTCVHIHQVYPYFFVEYTGKITPSIVTSYIAKLTQSLNHAIAISLKRNPSSGNSCFVRAIVLVKGVHFYGFHTSYSPFLKIHIADPAYVNRAATIMRSGTVMKTRFMVYESHLSYILQFLCDFGLYGCGWIDLVEVWQRGDEDEQDQEGHAVGLAFNPSSYYRQTRMPLEVDVAAHQILNRHQLSTRDIHHKLSIPAAPLPSEPLVISVRELWEDERRRRVSLGLSPTPEVPKELSESSRSLGAEWVAEARWWDEVQKRVQREKGREDVTPSTSGWDRWVMTTFESVEVLWEKPWRKWKPLQHNSQTGAAKPTDVSDANPYAIATGQSPQDLTGNDDVDVDEKMLSSQAVSKMVETEEVAWEKLLDEGVDDNDINLVDKEYAAAEDGPPPELQFDDTDSATGGDSPGVFESTHGTPARSNVAKSPSPALKKLARPHLQRDSPPISDMQFPQSTRGSDDQSSYVTPKKREFPPSVPEIPIIDLSPENPFLERITPVSPSPSSRPLTFPPVDMHEEHLSHETEVDTNVHQHHKRMASRKVAFAVPEIQASREKPSSKKSPHFLERTHNPGFGFLDSSSESEDGRPRKRPKLLDNEPLSMSLSTISRMKRVSKLSSTPFATFSKNHQANLHSYRYSKDPPSPSELLESFDAYRLPCKVYQDPYFSKKADAPDRRREYAGLIFYIKGGDGVSTLEEWDSQDEQKEHLYSQPILRDGNGLAANDVWGWEYANTPPSFKEVSRWMQEEGRSVLLPERSEYLSQIEGPTQLNLHGVQATPTPLGKPAVREKGNMEVFSLEVFAPRQGRKLPDPDQDEVAVIFWALHDTDVQRTDSESPFQCQSGVIAVGNEHLNESKLRCWGLDIVETEIDLLNRIIDVVQELDPDIITGWEVQSASWGYLSARGRAYGLDIGEQISRAPGRVVGGGSDQWGLRTTSTFKVVGRHVLNVWRIIRAEQTFTSYTLEHATFQLLRRRIPHYDQTTLSSWYRSCIPEHQSRLIQYFSTRTSLTLEILDSSEIVTKNAEFARVFGVDFFSVLSRGSQFKVESFMFRIAKPESFVLLSPSREDVGKQNAAECMPLIMEPLSAFYKGPLVVLDFQSLYPSIMIAYNYCYSTCLGRVVDFKGQNKLGVTELRHPHGLLGTLQDHINVAPNGIIYVKPEVRKGLLGRMLTELLDTRIMVKHAMKSVKNDKALKKVLDARQLGLKFIANVTYGYTSATYSGRMPAVEIADSIVQSGRETLEKAIRTIDSTPRWGAKVVYGDTDSLFIYLQGKTKEQAFRIGHDIADSITSMNPAPIKLKFEKVYLPCVLMAKKRYVGFKYENPDDTEPVFDAKGIETVRRDGVPAQQKMTETCLKLLFRTQDLSLVKEYCCASWSRILENKVSLQDFIFAKEVRMGTYSEKGPPPPGVTVAARRMVEDPNDEPQYGDRIPYVIIRGDPGTRLVDRAVTPKEILSDSQKRIDATYYISRVLIPPLERIFNLMGVDVRGWYNEMPKILRADETDNISLSPRKVKALEVLNKLKIEEHFVSSRCLTCHAPTLEGVCKLCRQNQQPTISRLLSRIHKTERRMRSVQEICAHCSKTPLAEPIQCESLDCPWLYERKRMDKKADAMGFIDELIRELEDNYLGHEHGA